MIRAVLVSIPIGILLGAGILYASSPKVVEPMPLVCKVAGKIDGTCWDGQGTRFLRRDYQVVEMKDGTYLVGWPE